MAAEIISLTTMLTGAGSGVLVPFVNKLLGPLADELGVTIAEHARIYRLSNTFKLFRKAQDMSTKAGFEPEQVNMKALLPLIEGASLEDDESLSDKWAALLANAADPSTKVFVKPAFADILRQLTPQDAILIDELFKQTELDNLITGRLDSSYSETGELRNGLAVNHKIRLSDVYQEQESLTRHDFDAMIDNLLRLRLLVAALPQVPKGGSEVVQAALRKQIERPRSDAAYFTALGLDFMQACTPPKAS